MRQLPSGTVTFLFTDIEGSTRRWEHDTPAMLAATERHFALLDNAIRANHGVRFKTIGDAIQAAFPTALDAVLAAVEAQRTLTAADWGSLGPLQVRMALHTGAATPHDGDYLAPALNRLARLLAAGPGGQILLTEATRLLVRDLLPEDIQLRDLGEHQLRDLREAEHVYQAVAPGLGEEFTPLKSLSRQTHNLPAQLTAFVGRNSVLAEAIQRLRREEVRLLTLTGPGGTGKTRLAVRVATELLDAYPDGVWFVALAPVTNPQMVAATIAETFGLREVPGESAVETLRAFLRPKRLLLLLDNFEQVIAGSPLLAGLLAGCPGLNILVTSRAPLRVTGEFELPVPPLELPKEEGRIDVEEALESEAVRLFVDRAQAVRGDFALTERNVGAVVAIARCLDGLPLAIELAAARIRLLAPEAILARLDSRLTLLTGGGRDRPERQQTLRAAIGWSYDLLDPGQQALFRRLAVFSGGWSFEEAEAIAAATDASDSVIDDLDVLHDNSLIQQVDPSDRQDASGPRFAMLQTIQEFGREQLAASGEMEAVKEAHASLFLSLAVEAEPHLRGRDAVVWLERLETEHGNLRAALAWLRKRDDGQGAVHMAAALWRFWWLRGHISEGRDELGAALAVNGASAEPSARATALDGEGVLAETQGDYERAAALHEEALALSRANGDTTGIARATGNLGVVAFDRGDDDAAESLLQESLALAREAADPQMVATALNDLGGVSYSRGALEKARSLYQESLGLRREQGNGAEVARSLNNLGAVAFRMSDFSQAHHLYAESLDLYRETGDKWGAAGALTGLAEAIRREGDTPRAASLLEEGLALFEETGDLRNVAVVLHNLGDAARDCGDLDEAAARYRAALSRFQSGDDRAGMVDCIAGVGGLNALAGHTELAARLLGAAAALADAGDLGDTQSDAEQFRADVASVQEKLGEPAFTAAWEEGERLSLTDAVAAALAAGPAKR